MSHECPVEAALVAFIRGEVSPSEQKILHEHVAACGTCYQVVVQLLASDDLPRDSLATEPLEAPAAPLKRGDSVGRYIVLDVVGRGGMGVVYAAYDPELDRKIAVKLIHSDVGSTRRKGRLLREAQAMARLSHPNVVPVHDVGTDGDAVFIAMELIHGETLRAWMRRKHPLPHIVKALAAAGRGLQAAHDAGLAHADLKPENILVGDDDRVRVSDFGLARSASGGDAEAVSSSAIRLALIAGTPAYMAPEQLRGRPADARSDQFAFCTVAWEALFGTRPFVAPSGPELLAAMEAGPPEPPAAARVPPYLRRAIARGLLVDPSLRWPSLSELIGELERDPAARLRRAGVLGGGLALLALAALSLFQGTVRERRQCRSDESLLAGVWDGPARERMAERFHASARPNAERALQRVTAAFDRFAGSWLRMRTDACEATHVRGEQSAQLLDYRMDCLRQRASQVRALSAMLQSADGQLVDNAEHAVEGVDDLRECADVRALRERTPPPADPVARAAYDRLHDHLAQMSALNRAGRHRDGAAGIDAVVDEAKQLAHPILLSDAYMFQGRFRRMNGRAPDAEQSFHLAAMAADRGNDGARRATAWDALALAAMDVGKLDDAARWLAYAGAAGEHASLDDFARGFHQGQVAQLARKQSRFADAAAAEKRATPFYEAAGNHGAVVLSLAALAQDLGELGQLEEATRTAERALRLVDEKLGRDHPYADYALEALAVLETSRAHYAEAEALYTRMHAREVAAFGEHSTMTYITLINLANSQVDNQHAPAALQTVAQAEALARRGPTEPDMGQVLQLIKARALLDVNRADEAARILDGVVLWAHQADHAESDRAVSDFALARARHDRKRAGEAAVHAASLPDTPDNRRLRAAIAAWLGSP